MDLMTYTQSQINILFLHLEGVTKTQDIEDIHQMRVKIKELRALWRLVETIHTEYLDRKYLKQNSRELFKKAGIVREIQVNLQMLDAHPQKFLQPVRDCWNDDLSKASNGLSDFLKTFDQEAFRKVLTDTLPVMQKITNQEIMRGTNLLIQKKLNKAHQLQERLPDDHWLHKIRVHLKVIKEILAILSLLEMDRGKKTFRNKINSLSKRLGNWHDEVVFIQEMKNMDLSEMVEWKQKAIQRMVSRHEDKKQKQEKHLLHQLVGLRKYMR